MRAAPRGSRFRTLLCAVLTAFVMSSTASPVHASQNPFDYFGGLRYDPNIPSPESILGYEIGEHFTRHSEMVTYLQHLADVSDRVEFRQYGQSFQRRSLQILTISSPANLRRLDDILETNRRLSDPSYPLPDLSNQPAIAWMSYNVHGNEPSGTEAGIQVAYTLAAGLNEEVEAILENVVVVIDPLLNPDGRERYVSWFQNTRGNQPIPAVDAAEHHEPWPGGRTNHYLFDLNRDWVWMIQPESAARMKVYREYMPQLHIDYHEQGYRNPYFLGAGDSPYNTNIPEETRAWVEKYGHANASVFDAHHLEYSTRERFDYLYPGYGKVLPVYHGAVGMLAEQAGHSMGGVAIRLDEQRVLTLQDRSRHHYLLTMSNLDTTGELREEQLQRFYRYFRDSTRDPRSGPQSIIITTDNDPKLLQQTWELCQAHGIRIERLASTLDRPSGLYEYADATEVTDVRIPAGSWVISTRQPMGRLAQALFEREVMLEDIETYDITGWSVPVVFGLDAYYSSEAVPTNGPLVRWAAPEPELTGGGNETALLVDATAHDFPLVLAMAAQRDLAIRIAGEAFEIDELSFSAGSLIAYRIANPRRNLDAFATDVQAAGFNVHWATQGVTTSGPVLGANANVRFEPPNIILLRDSPISSNSFGQHWYLLDQKYPFPYSPVNVDRLGSVNLDDYNVLMIPDSWGGLSGEISESLTGRLRDWIRAGGTVVASGSAAMWAATELADIPQDNLAVERSDEEAIEQMFDDNYDERRAKRAVDGIPGPLVQVNVDTTHPMASGVRDWVGVIKRGDRVLPVAKHGYIVGRFDETPHISGHISEENRNKLAGQAFMTIHATGSGSVICLSDDVTIRGFCHAPTRLLMNAIGYGPTF